MNNTIVFWQNHVFEFLLFDIARCEQVCKQWKNIIKKLKICPSLHTCVKYKQFKDWMCKQTQSKQGAFIELSGPDVLFDATTKTLKDGSFVDKKLIYQMHRYWTIAPLFYLRDILKEGIFLEVRANEVEECFPNFFIVKANKNHTILFKKYNKDPILETLRCSEHNSYRHGTISENQRFEMGNAFMSGWYIDQKSDKHAEKQIVLDWTPVNKNKDKKYVYGTKYEEQTKFHHLNICQFLLNGSKINYNAKNQIYIKAITIVSKNSFLSLKFEPLLDWNAYILNLNL